jgi:hypothetical protein
MKTKLSKILGIGFALVLVASLLLFAIPVAAGPYEDLEPVPPNMWLGFDPTPGLLGAWFFDPAITQVGPLAQAIDGDIYAYVAGTNATPPTYNPGTEDIFKSTDGGRTWSVSSLPYYYLGGPVVDMVCSSMSEDVIYLTDGYYVWKSINGGLSFAKVAEDSLETVLIGCCGPAYAITDITTQIVITSIDVGYDGAGKPIVFIGTLGHSYDCGPGAVVYPGSVYFIADETFPSEWVDLDLGCYPCCAPLTGVGCYDVYAVAAAPNFATSGKVYAVISSPLTSITFPLNTASQIEIRAGDNGADFTYTALPGDVSCSAAPSPVTLTANATCTFDADTTHAAGTTTIAVTDGTISWRLVSGSATICGGTKVIYSLGAVCGWTDVAEIQWNCQYSFAIQHASRIMFPSYYATEPTLFVGVAAVEDWDTNTGSEATLNDYWGEGGDVYRVADSFPVAPGSSIDLNIQGFTTGCLGFKHANICSLDLENDALVAGAWDPYQLQSPTRVYYSADGGWTWAPSKKDPTGTNHTYVLFGSSIVAGTTGCDCAFSLSCGANLGDFFNQISLISMSIDTVLDMTHAPGYVLDSQTMYVLTQDVIEDDSHPCFGLTEEELRGLLRWDGTYWERVHSSRFYYAAATQPLSGFLNSPLYDWVEVSPDFNSTDCVYMANTGFFMARTIDAGCSWAPLVYPCYDRPAISAWIVVDEDTILAAGCANNAGYVYRTTNHGAQPWTPFKVLNALKIPAGCGVDFDLSIPRAADSDVLFGDALGQVYLSQDLGATWAEIRDVNGTTAFNYNADGVMTYVVFDPGYGTAGDPGENTFYAAAGTDIGRCTYNAAALPFKQDWLYLSTAVGDCQPCTLCVASGIDATGDTCLYVADAGSQNGESNCYDFTGTIGVRYFNSAYEYRTCDLTITNVCAYYSSGTFTMGEPVTLIGCNLQCDGTTGVDGWIQVEGLVNGGIARIPIDVTMGAECQACLVDGALVECIDSDLYTSSLMTAGTSCATGVWRTLNPLALIDESKGWNFVEFEFLGTGLIPPQPTSLLHPAATEPTTVPATPAFTIYPDDLWLTAGSNVLWALDVGYPDYVWMWGDPLAAPVVQVSPADGALLATSTQATIEWEALDGASLYEFELYEECPECLNPLEMKPVVLTISTTTATCITLTELTPGTKYFWRVRVACDSPQVSKWSDYRSFDTALSATIFCSPECGAEDITLTPNFSWSAVTDATSYEIEVSLSEDFDTLVASGTPTINAWDGIPELDYSTTYYWRVRAVKDGVYSGWTYCLFSTIEEPAEPVEPVEPVEIVQEEITPTWIWVIIGIGGALTIAVIILIVTTRRVP